MEILAYVREKGLLKPLWLSISRPEPLEGEDDFWCEVAMPAVIRTPQVIRGAERNETIELALTFVKETLRDMTLLDENGAPMAFPWDKISLGSRHDDGARNNAGIAASLIRLDSRRFRLVFDDIRADSQRFPQTWQASGLHSWVDLDASKLLNHDLSEKQYEEIGFNLVSRLVAACRE